MVDIDTRQTPLVSVCLPTFNRAQRMKRAVEALLAGEYSNIEILVSDNGSSDETQSVAEDLVSKNSRVRYFRHAENIGPVANFEFVRRQARGKYFLWHGDDDYLGADYIRACVEELERDSSLVLVSGLAAYHYLGSPETTHYGNIIQPGSESPRVRIVTYLWNVGENSIFCGVYRVDSVSQCSIPNRLAGDWMWMTGVLLQGRALVIPTVHVHRDYGDSASLNMARLVAVQGLPAWHARAPWTAITIHFMHHLLRALRRSGISGVRAFVFCAVVLIVLLARVLRNHAGILVRGILQRCRPPRAAGQENVR